MYDYSGIKYQIWGECGILVLLGVIFVIVSLIHKKEEFKKRYAGIGLGFFVCGLIFSLEYFAYLNNPNIQVQECSFYDETRNSHGTLLPLNWKYTFCDEEGNLATFYLDTFSKKDIYDEEFAEGDLYRIYYEVNTSIIVKVEYLGSE